MGVASTPIASGAALASTDVGRRVDVDQLVSAVEIAARLGVTRPQAVYDWRRRHADFPEPVTRLGAVYVWVWDDVAKWARKTGRLR